MWGSEVQRSLLLPLAIFVVAGCHAKDGKVLDLKFDIGTPVAKTLKPHGVPYSGKNVNGLMMYGFTGFPDGSVSATYSRPGYDVHFGPIFDIHYYADLKRHPDQIIHLADISLDHHGITSHSAAQAEVNKLVAQFQHGDWKRYIPDSCPWVTGRSTLLDASRRVSISACPLDPALVISAQEWPQIAAQKLRWQWIGDGRIATLEATYAYDKPNVPTYTINLQFELQEAVKFYDAQSLREMKAEFGEAKVAAGAAKGAAEIKLLEEAAIKRGDSTIARP